MVAPFKFNWVLATDLAVEVMTRLVPVFIVKMLLVPLRLKDCALIFPAVYFTSAEPVLLMINDVDCRFF